MYFNSVYQKLISFAKFFKQMIRKILPDIIKDIIRKVRTKPHAGYPEYGLLKSQVYQKGQNLLLQIGTKKIFLKKF